MSHSVNSTDNTLLPEPLDYFPVSLLPFEFKAGLRRLNPDVDEPDRRDMIFQLDRQWSDYRHTKLASRDEKFDKYVCRESLPDDTAAQVTALLIRQLNRDYPLYFPLEEKSGHCILHCRLSNETLVFDGNMVLTRVVTDNVGSPYHDGLDALCCQVQEDVAVNLVNNGDDHITYLHLCLPNYWAPQDKIGRSFITAHEPVPAMDRIIARSGKLLDTLLQEGPFERFTWGLTTDARLNHHPLAPENQNPRLWHGRAFDPARPELYLRIERQVTVGIPEGNAFIFTIRTYLHDTGNLNSDQRRTLAQAIRTMPEPVLAYKELMECKDEIIAWLTTGQLSSSKRK